MKKYIFGNQIIAAVLLILLGWFLFEIRGILVSLFISFIIMTGLSSPVEFLKNRRFPNVVAVSISYLVALFVIVLLIVPLIPFVNSQMQALIHSFPVYLDRAAGVFGITLDQNYLRSYISSEFSTIGRNAFTLTGRVLGGLFSVLTVLVVSFYLLLDRERVKKRVINIFPKDNRQEAAETIMKVEDRLGAWLRGQIVLSLFIGVITYIALSLLHLPFALPLALLAGLLEIVPTLGPILASIPAIIVAFTISPTLALTIIGVYILIQLVENNVLVPQIMNKAVGLHPIVIIIAVMIGTKMMGIVGALLAIPFISMMVIIYQVFKKNE